jgi:hypothetical protein
MPLRYPTQTMNQGAYQMYDGTDVALVLGGVLSGCVAGFSLVFAVISLSFCLARKRKNETAAASLWGRWAVFFVVTAVLCGMSIASGWVTYNLFEHQRGYSNPPAHVIAVGSASVWGLVAAGMFGYWWLRTRNKEPGGESNPPSTRHGR